MLPFIGACLPAVGVSVAIKLYSFPKTFRQQEHSIGLLAVGFFGIKHPPFYRVAAVHTEIDVVFRGVVGTFICRGRCRAADARCVGHDSPIHAEVIGFDRKGKRNLRFCIVCAGNGKRFAIIAHIEPGFRLNSKGGGAVICRKSRFAAFKALTCPNNIVSTGGQVDCYRLITRIPDCHRLRGGRGITLRHTAKVKRSRFNGNAGNAFVRNSQRNILKRACIVGFLISVTLFAEQVQGVGPGCEIGGNGKVRRTFRAALCNMSIVQIAAVLLNNSGNIFVVACTRAGVGN